MPHRQNLIDAKWRAELMPDLYQAEMIPIRGISENKVRGLKAEQTYKLPAVDSNTCRVYKFRCCSAFISYSFLAASAVSIPFFSLRWQLVLSNPCTTSVSRVRANPGTTRILYLTRTR